MDIGKAFTFMFEDDEWIVKIAIAAVLAFIPIIGWIPLGGWMLEISRRVATGRQDVLPEWDDLGTYTIRGLKAAVILLIYYLPYIVLSACVYSIPFLISGGQVSDSVELGITVIEMAVKCVIFAYFVFVTLLIPAALMRFVMNDDDITAGLAFMEVLTLVKNNLMAYITVYLGYLVLTFLVPLGVLVLCVGVLFTIPYSVAVLGHLYGQAYAEATGGGMVSTGTSPAAPAASADWEG